MVIRVEMFGPMGAGKSTLYNALRRSRKWTRMRGVVNTAIDEKTLILAREARERSWLYYVLLRALSHVPVVMPGIVASRITNSAWLALAKREEEWSEFASHVLYRRVEVGTSMERSLRRLAWFIQELSDVALLEEHAQSSVVIHDESLLQRGLGLSLDTESGEEFLKRYVQLVPGIGTVVFVSVPIEVARERIVQRQRSDADLHIRVLDQAFRRSHLVIKLLEARGIPVIHVDGLQPPEINAERIRVAVQALIPT